MQCIIARYECQACEVDSAPLQWMLALPAERPNTRITATAALLQSLKQQGLAACKTLAYRGVREGYGEPRDVTSLSLTSRQGPGRARRTRARPTPPTRRFKCYAREAAPSNARPRVRRRRGVLLAYPNCTGFTLLHQPERVNGPPEGADALSVHVYWKCVDGRLAANVLLNFFSGARTMRCGSGNLRRSLAYWIVAGRFRSALFSTTPVLII